MGEGPFLAKVFKPGAFAVRAVAIRDIDAKHRCENFDDLLRRDEHSEVIRERLMAGGSTNGETEVDAGFYFSGFFDDSNGARADVIGVLE